MGVQMAKYLYPMGIEGAGMIMDNPHPHTHLPAYGKISFWTCIQDIKEDMEVHLVIFQHIFFHYFQAHILPCFHIQLLNFQTRIWLFGMEECGDLERLSGDFETWNNDHLGDVLI
jgi:hypothetical protein